MNKLQYALSIMTGSLKLEDINNSIFCEDFLDKIGYKLYSDTSIEIHRENIAHLCTDIVYDAIIHRHKGDDNDK